MMHFSNPLLHFNDPCQTEKASSPLGGGYGDDDYDDYEEDEAPIASSSNGGGSSRNTAASDGYEDYDDYESSVNVRVRFLSPPFVHKTYAPNAFGLVGRLGRHRSFHGRGHQYCRGRRRLGGAAVI